MDSQSPAAELQRATVRFCEEETSDSEDEEAALPPASSSLFTRANCQTRYMSQSDSKTAAALLLLRQRQIALGDLISGDCLKFLAEDENLSDSEEEEDLSKLMRMDRKLSLKEYQNRRHLLRPLRSKSQETLRARVFQRLPLSRLCQEATWGSCLSDAVAGLTVGVMGVPESLSYANIASLPFEYGLYALVVPQFIYSLLGQSRQLMVGPVAMLSLLLHAGLEGGLDEHQCPLWYNQTRGELELQSEVCREKYIDMAMLMSMMSGCVLLLACVLQLGFLLKFLGHPVVSGFSSGSAIVIMMSQLKNFLGVKVPESEFPILMLYYYARAVPHCQPVTLGLGLLFTLGLLCLRKLGQRFKLRVLGSLGPLLSCALGVLLIYLCKPLQDLPGLEYMGEIPGGNLPLSVSSFSRWTWWDVKCNLPFSLSVALIGFLEAFATAQSLAKQHGQQLSSSQEMLALGAANILGSVWTAYPSSGSFSRSAVCNSTGGSSQLAGLVSAGLSLLALLYLTPLFYYLPKFVLAAIVVSSVTKLVAYDVAISLFKVKKSDFLMWVTAFLGTLCLGPLLGIGLAVLLSLAVVIYESVHPQIQVLWRIEGTNSYRSIQQDPNGAFIDGVFIVRIGGSLYFANVAYVEETLLTFIEDINAISKMEYLILDFTPVTTADFSAMEALRDVVQDFRHKGVQVAFTCMGDRLERGFQRFGLMDFLSEEWCFPSVHEAVVYCICRCNKDPKGSFQQEMETALRELERAEAQELELAAEAGQRSSWNELGVGDLCFFKGVFSKR
ncbi:unnamed protein product [Effrenium voratum]|nr:unnamed protein product [Effrenium voratum]